MRNKRLILAFAFFFLVIALLLVQASAQIPTGSASFVKTHSPNINNYYGDKISTYYPILAEKDSCRARQDIVLQVSPIGCQPAVVRGDLLADQNVPVFCQVDALKLNPILDVNSIRNIQFSTQSASPGVVGVGFHPARAALRTNTKLTGSPLIDNIGYAVVVLKKNEVESTLPDSVQVNLTARIEYDAANAVGIGRTDFLLKLVPDAEWESEKLRQSFLRGEYSARLIDADPNFATVALYYKDNKISTTRIERGKPSEVYVPGGYCQVSLRLHYDGFVAPEKTVRLKIDNDAIDVYKGSRFLNNKCTVLDITGTEADSKVDLRCGSERFSLGIKPKVLSPGTGIYRISEFKEKGENSSTYDILSYDNKTKEYSIVPREGPDVNKSIQAKSNEVIPIETNLLFEATYSKEAEDAFNKAISEYLIVVERYPTEKKTGDAVESYIGEEALYSAIELARAMRKGITEANLIEKFLSTYPNSAHTDELINRLNSLHAKDNSLSAKSIELDNKAVYIEMIDFTSPVESRKATFSIEGLQSQQLSVGTFNFTGINNAKASLSVQSIEQNRVKVSGTCAASSSSSSGGLSSTTLTLGSSPPPTASLCGRVIKLESIELEQYAKIRIDPDVKNAQSGTNLTVNIGIEKSAIKLSPEKAQEKITRLDESIKKWESISNNLGEVVTGLKTACFATAGVLTVKNFFAGLSGESLARQEVMSGPDGWTDFCNNNLKVNGGKYASLTQCYNENSDEINKDVAAQAKAISQVNEQLKQIESAPGISTTSDGFFGGKMVDREKASQELITRINNECGDLDVSIPGQTAKVGDIIDSKGHTESPLSYEQLRDIYRDCLVLKGEAGAVSQNSKAKAQSSLNTFIAQAELRNVEHESLANAKSLFSGSGLANSFIPAAPSGSGRVIEYSGGTLNPGDFKGQVDIPSKSSAQPIIGPDGDTYIILIEQIPSRPNDYSINQDLAYRVKGENVIKLEGENVTKVTNGITYFKKVDATSYNNQFAEGEARQIQYYETEPYKGMPAIVPFDLQKGWYVATKQTLPGFGNIKSFESSGRPVSFWICNVGENKRPEFFNGVNDDICRQFNMQTGQPLDKFPGLSEQDTSSLMQRAISALNKAADNYGKQSVNIEGQTLRVGRPASSIPGTQCQDFMSPEDCLLLFNVCDPVICPSSRCDLGGAYPVSDVVQTGVVGSALLCLPNLQEGVVAPVCLTGIKAGIDGYVSILKSHQACLKENIETGRTVGICDQIYSVYACEFFWRQAAPVANILLPKVVEFAYSGGQQGARGGGEYLTVQSAWENAEQSVNFFTQNYAANAFEAFNIRSIEEAGTPFCRAFVSAKAPSAFKTLVEPDSPAQFHAFFSEIPFSDTTVPATSQYKVFYHIFAGNDAGVHYSVYLRDPPETSYYATNPTVTVATGFAPRGGFATETRDFTAPAGYRELCVRINNKEECGFKQVSTSFALNAVRDSFVQDQIEQTNIMSESECISGSLNPSLLLTPNIQEAAQEAIDPAIYNRGVIRICSTHNPGEKTDPSRFVRVGQCDTPAVSCWLDKNSVDNALSRNVPINAVNGSKAETLSELNAIQADILRSTDQIYDDNEATDILKVLNERVENFEGTPSSEAQTIENELNLHKEELFFNHFIAQIHSLVGKTYGKVAQALAPKLIVTNSGEDLSAVPEEPSAANPQTPENESPADSGEEPSNDDLSNYYNIKGDKLYLGEQNLGIVLLPQQSGAIRLVLESNQNTIIGIYTSTSSTLQVGSVPSSAQHLTEHLQNLEGQTYADLLAGDRIASPTLGEVTLNN